jgi:hypothetical protein
MLLDPVEYNVYREQALPNSPRGSDPRCSPDHSIAPAFECERNQTTSGGPATKAKCDKEF